MNQDDRDKIYDKLPLTKMKIWPNEEERERFGKTIYEWAGLLGHPDYSASHTCCKTCGCATTCMYGLFFDAMVDTIIMELDKIGHLQDG